MVVLELEPHDVGMESLPEPVRVIVEGREPPSREFFSTLPRHRPSSIPPQRTSRKGWPSPTTAPASSATPAQPTTARWRSPSGPPGGAAQAGAYNRSSCAAC